MITIRFIMEFNIVMSTSLIFGIHKKIVDIGFLLILLISPWQISLAEGIYYPKDIQRFLDNVEECQYYAGEWDSSLPKARQHKIEQGVKKYCDLARKQQEALKDKYKGNKDIESIINEMDF